MSIADFVITASLILVSVFLVLSILFFKKAKKIKLEAVVKKKEEKGVDFKKLKEDWQAVLGHLDSINESDWKLAIIEADKIINELLIQKGYSGESMAEKMSLINKKEVKSIELLWEAHKIRNRIAHQPGFKLDYNQAKKTISYYQEVLKDLQPG